MFRTRLRRLLFTWLTLVAMGLGALAPTLAQAVARHGDSAVWVQVCSSTGMLWVRADAYADAPATGSSETGGHPFVQHQVACPWCAMPGDMAAPPPAGLVPVAAAWDHALPSAQTWARPTAVDWLMPPTRAPPRPV